MCPNHNNFDETKSPVCDVEQPSLQNSLKNFPANSENRDENMVPERHKEPEQIAEATDNTRVTTLTSIHATGEGHDAYCESQSETSITTQAEIPKHEQKDDLAAVLAAVFESLPDAPAIESRDCFFCAIDEPSITMESLSELDIRRIAGNVKLRHDLNFELELHFRPNLDGDRGVKKQEIQKGYWSAVEVELYLYNIFYGNAELANLPGHVDVSKLNKRIQKRLPLMLEKIKEIVINLISQRDQAAVQRDLDVQMLMQEIEKQVCDIGSIAQALASLLKRHCAPMRDDMVDGMVDKIRRGDASSISAGLRDLFGVLEAMKLDVANHHIRNSRGIWIKDIIDSEQRYHLDKICRGQIDAIGAREWYLDYMREIEFLCPNTPASERGLRALITGLVCSLLPTSGEELPQTFALDARRLRTLKAELEELHFLSICRAVFVELVRSRGVTILPSSQASESLLRVLHDILRTWPAPDFPNTPISLSNVSIEIARQAARYCGKGQELDSDLNDQAESLLKRLWEGAREKDTNTKQYAKRLRNELVEAVLRAIRDGKYLTMSTWDLFNALVPVPSNPGSLGYTQSQFTIRKHNIIRRITHIGVLHWRIWAPILYLNEKVLEIRANDSLTTSPIPADSDQGQLSATTQDPAVLSTTAPLEPSIRRPPSPTRFPTHEP